tara:strand:- start:1436 stop:2617 length:1182 start_codon:yes stop_codon:yes gene_type:complete
MANKGLLGTTTKQSYYSQSQSFTTANGVITGSNGEFTLTTAYFPTLPTTESQIQVFINNIEINKSNYTYNAGSNYRIVFTNTNINSSVQETSGAPKTGLVVKIKESTRSEKYGGYRYVSLQDITNNFMIGYVGNGKLIKNIQRSDILFYARRGIQEFAYDVSRVEKIQEIDVGPNLNITMPQDYINYVKITWVDSAGVEHLIMPARYTSKPSESILQASDYTYMFDEDGDTLVGSSTIDTNFKDSTVSNLNNAINDDYYYNTEYNRDRILHEGRRYGLEPELANKNGVFIIDEANGTINFSSDLDEKTIILKYISDGVGTDSEMQVHKFAEEAMYKHIAFNILSAKENIPEYIINRYRKDKRAALRNAKIRLSNIKIEELTQIMRGKSKHIKS